MKNSFIIVLLFFYTTFLSAQNPKGDRIILKTNETYTGEIVLQNEEVIILKSEDGSRFQFPLDDIKTITKAGRDELQVMPDRRIITLKTGQVYYGEVILENEQIVMIKTADGSRFQFPLNEIQSIEKDLLADSRDNNYNEFAVEDNNFVMIADISLGFSHAGRAYGWAPSLQGALVLGGKDVFIPGMFIGGGVGYNVILPSNYNNSEILNFLPVFLRLQSVIGKNSIAPYVEMDGGYSFSLSEDYGGGLMLKISAGIAIRLSHRANLYVGIYGGIQNFSGDMKTSYNSDDYSYYGKTSMQNAGLKLALRF